MCQQQQLFEIATKDQNISLNKNQIEENRKVKEK